MSSKQALPLSVDLIASMGVCVFIPNLYGVVYPLLEYCPYIVNANNTNRLCTDLFAMAVSSFHENVKETEMLKTTIVPVYSHSKDVFFLFMTEYL